MHSSYKSLTVNGKPVLIGWEVITALDGKPVPDAETLRALVAAHEPGDEITLTTIRNGKELRFPVELGKAP